MPSSWIAGDRTDSPNSEPSLIKLCSEFRERVEPDVGAPVGRAGTAERSVPRV